MGFCYPKAAIFSKENLQSSIICVAFFFFFRLKHCPATENCDEEFAHVLFLGHSYHKKAICLSKSVELSSTYRENVSY